MVRAVVEAKGTVSSPVELANVNDDTPPNTSPLLNCTYVSLPPGIPPALIPSDEVARRS